MQIYIKHILPFKSRSTFRLVKVCQKQNYDSSAHIFLQVQLATPAAQEALASRVPPAGQVPTRQPCSPRFLCFLWPLTIFALNSVQEHCMQSLFVCHWLLLDSLRTLCAGASGSTGGTGFTGGTGVTGATGKI